MIKQSFSWWCYNNRGVDDLVLLQKAKEIGYTGVELMPVDKFDAARDAGLTIVSHNGHASIEQGLNDPSNHARIEREIIANLDLAVKQGILNLIVFSGSRRADLSDELGAENTVIGLQRIAKAAEQAGVTLALELLNSKVDHPGYQGDRTPWIVNVIESVGSPRVKALYDIYHAQIMEGDIIRTIRAHHAHFCHYHTAGNPGRGDLDETQEILYAPILKTIAATGYDAYIGHEFIARGNPVDALRAAYEMTAASLA